MELKYWWLPLVVFALLIAAVVFALLVRRRRPGGVPVAHSERLTALPGYRRAVSRARVLGILVGGVVTVALVVSTLATARWVYTRVVVPEKYNRDIVLCLDVSGSMTEYDAKVIDRYLQMLPGFNGERMSLVLWNSSPAAVFPLTDDYAFVKTQLEQVRDAMVRNDNSAVYTAGTLNRPGASLVGDGLASCVLQFPIAEDVGSGAQPGAVRDDGRSRSIILATDNVINGSPTVSFAQAAKFAADNFISVYGLDANEFPDAYADEYRTLMQQNGWQYFPLTADNSVSEIVDAITSDQTNTIRGAAQLFVVDRPEVWLWAMLVMVPLVLVCVRRLRV